MRKTASWLATVALLLISVASVADSFSEGKSLYKAGRYADAAAKLEQAAKEKPTDARVWWQLSFAYHKLNREADSLSAVKKADQLDPSHGFASEAGKFQQILADRQRTAGQVAPRTGSRQVRPVTSNGAGTAQGMPTDYSFGGVTKRLVDGDVYIDPGMTVDGGRLQQVSNDLRPVIVKFAVFNNNAGSSALDREAHKIRDYLNVKNGYVIASSRRGVAVASNQLNQGRLRDLTKQIAPTMETGHYTEGLETLARGLVQTRAKQTVAATNTWLIVIGVIVGVIVLWAFVGGAKKKRAMAVRREPLERTKSDVINQMNFLDDNVALLDPSWASRVREARVSAGTKLDQASALIRNANSVSDLDRAQQLLSQALSDCSRGRSFIDQAMSGKSSASAPSGTTAPPVISSPSSGAAGGVPNWDSVPQDQRGVCFFCSKPSLLSELTPVTVNLSGQQQKVLACPDDLHTIRSGQMPQIRAFNVNGNYVPWYAYNQYDPYHDYYSRGYGGGSLLSDLVTLSIIDNMFWNWHHPVGWGWGGGWGYGGPVFYADHHYYNDYYGGQAASYGDFDRTPSDAGGTDFLGSTGGDSSGADFGGTGFGGGIDHS